VLARGADVEVRRKLSGAQDLAPFSPSDALLIAFLESNVNKLTG
jgi:hypothetical protein